MPQYNKLFLTCGYNFDKTMLGEVLVLVRTSAVSQRFEQYNQLVFRRKMSRSVFLRIYTPPKHSYVHGCTHKFMIHDMQSIQTTLGAMPVRPLKPNYGRCDLRCCGRNRSVLLPVLNLVRLELSVVAFALCVCYILQLCKRAGMQALAW